MLRRAGLAPCFAVLLALAAPALGRAEPAPQSDEDVPYIGISLAIVDASGRWSGRWLGAHPLTRDGATYVVGMAAASWTVLQGTLRAGERGSYYLLGDLPYVGDGVCAPGTLRRWWSNGELAGDGSQMRWEAASVPDTAPALSCPVSLGAEAPLVVQAVPAPTPP